MKMSNMGDMSSVSSKQNKSALCRISVFAFSFCLCLGLMACSGINGKIPDKKQVVEAIYKQCPTETVKMVSIDKEPGPPKEWTYHVESTERDLHFTAVSGLRQIDIDGGYLPLYDPIVRVDYIKSVQELYRDSMREKVQESAYFHSANDNGLLFTEYDQLEELCHDLYDISSIFTPESKYNDRAWMEKNAPIWVRIYYVFPGDDPEVLANTHVISYLAMDGCRNYEEFYQKVTTDLGQKITDGQLDSVEGVPESLLEEIHKSYLKTIYVDDIELTPDMVNGSAQEGHYNRTDRAVNAFYDKEFGEYVVMLDAYTVPVECDPHPLEAYVTLVGGSIETKHNGLQASWEIDGVSYELKVKETPDDLVEQYTVTMNGRDMKIRYHNQEQSAEIGIPHYMVTVPVTDLGMMINRKVDINEVTEEVKFYK